MKRGILWMVLLLSLGVNVGVLATLAAQRLRQPSVDTRPAARDQAPIRSMLESLDLEGEERRRFMELQRRLFERIRRSRHELERVRVQIRRELVAEKPDRRRLEELARRSAKLTAAMDLALIDTVLQSRGQLPPEDRDRYLRLLSHLRERARQR